MSFQQYDIALQRTSGEQIKVRNYREKLSLAQGKLPGERQQALKRLADTRKYIDQVGKAQIRENNQHKDVNKQVGEQQKKIVSAAKDLARQAGEARLNLNKYRHAAFEQKKYAIITYRDAVEKWWENAFEGLEKSLRETSHINGYIITASKAMQEALMGTEITGKSLVVARMSMPWQKQYNFKWKDWLEVREQRQAAVMPVQEPPSRQSVENSDKQIAKLDEAGFKQNAKIREHEGKLKGATASLATRAKAAHAKIDAAVKQRGVQLVKGRKQEAALIKHLKYLEGRSSELASEQSRMGTAASQLARQRAAILQGRAKAAARAKYDAQLGAYQKRVAAYKKAAAAAKKGGQRPPKPPTPPNFPGWYTAELKKRMGR